MTGLRESKTSERWYPPARKSGMSAATLAVTPGIPFTSGNSSEPTTTPRHPHPGVWHLAPGTWRLASGTACCHRAHQAALRRPAGVATSDLGQSLRVTAHCDESRAVRVLAYSVLSVFYSQCTLSYGFIGLIMC
ncbi:hypothetical protein O3G_MSEX012198 [Manduca sexta]|uniref:Uncharacterized protein n=1 Tax=Manduca sexta TaxID=7130 RepID=A0A921ZN97_MANSE|nr:hypothetical protein O3G_MSEX012198 [Manduca sexta]